MVSENSINMLKCIYIKGTKILLKEMKGESQLSSGLKGIVTNVDDIGQIHVDWENGSKLALIYGTDDFEIDCQ